MQALTLQLQRIVYEVRRLTFRQYVMKKRLTDTEFDFVIGDYVGKQWYGSASGEANCEIQFLRDLVRPGDVALEAGAHHGLITMLLSQWVGEKGRVVAVEAMAHNAKIIQQNVRLNSCTNVRVDQAVVGPVNGSAEISHRSNASVIKPGSGAGVRVPMRTLNWYAGDRPTFVKLDVEGYEVQALRAAGDLLKAGPRWAIEVHIPELAQRGESPDELLEHLAGYELWLQPRGDVRPRPYQGERLSALAGPQVHLYAFPR